MKKLLAGILILGSISTFAGTAKVVIVGFENGNPVAKGVKAVSNANPNCVSGKLIGSTDDIESDLQNLKNKDEVEISASQLSRECIYLVRSFKRLNDDLL
jgi:hypothetical protein